MKRVRFADAVDEDGNTVLPKTSKRRPSRTLLPGPEQGICVLTNVKGLRCNFHLNKNTVDVPC
jgi:hypothetical protein